jgi:hypothetical protein
VNNLIYEIQNKKVLIFTKDFLPFYIYNSYYEKRSIHFSHMLACPLYIKKIDLGISEVNTNILPLFFYNCTPTAKYAMFVFFYRGLFITKEKLLKERRVRALQSIDVIWDF